MTSLISHSECPTSHLNYSITSQYYCPVYLFLLILIYFTSFLVVVLYYAVLCCAVVCCTMLYCGVLYCGVVWCAMLWCGVPCCGVLRTFFIHSFSFSLLYSLIPSITLISIMSTACMKAG